METLTDTSSAPVNAEQLAQTIETQAATDAHTIGAYVNDVRRTSNTLMQAGGTFAETAKKLEQNADDVEQASDGSTSITIDATLEPGLNGFTYVGGTDSDITVNAGLLYQYDTASALKELDQTIKHEKRHNDQVELQTGGESVIFVTSDGREITDPTLFYEGDTERHTAEEFGRRKDQPKEYAEGHDMANDITADHTDAWTETLTVTGDLASLQGNVWEAGLKDGSLTMDELIVQADQTGYTDTAAEVLSRHIQQQSSIQ